MDPISLGVGALSLLAQLFNGCVLAYSYFSIASQIDVDTARLLTKIKLEEARLLIWGREWGVADGKLEMKMEAHSLMYSGGGNLSQVAVRILEQLHRTITDFKNLEKRYGIREQRSQQEEEREGEEKGKGKGKEYVDCNRILGTTEKDNGKKGGGGGGNKVKSAKMSLRKDFAMKARWAIMDKDKFVDLLHDLKDYNDGLYRLFPAYRHASLSRQLTHDVLYSAERNISDLSLIEHASNGEYPQLNASASLKKLKINLESKSQTAFKATIAFRIRKQTLTIADNPAIRKRIPAFHAERGSVIVEWVDYNTDEKMLHMRRLDDLARLMHSASDCHPDLHTIDCVGYTDDQDKSRFGLIYKVPESTSSSLHSLIAGNDLKTPDLQDRIKLAQTLAIALWSLHSLEWLHKSFCSSNILFFPSATSAAATKATASSALVPDISRPYLVGFDASRPDLDTEVSVVSRNPSIHDLHRHPSLIGSTTVRVQYVKSHDIYSLGLILLEVGLWKVLQTFHKPSYTADRWRDRVVLNVLVPGLGSKTGRLYREVVDKCLRVSEDMDNDEAGQLMEQVVKTLESIRV